MTFFGDGSTEVMTISFYLSVSFVVTLFFPMIEELIGRKEIIIKTVKHGIISEFLLNNLF